VNRSGPGQTGTAVVRGLVADEEPEPITATVGTPTGGGRVAVGVVGAVIGTAVVLLVRWVFLAQRMWCADGVQIGDGVTRCMPVTDTMKTVTNWVFLGGIGVLWVIAALAALGVLSSIGGQSAGQDDIDEGERP